MGALVKYIEDLELEARTHQLLRHGGAHRPQSHERQAFHNYASSLVQPKAESFASTTSCTASTTLSPRPLRLTVAAFTPRSSPRRRKYAVLSSVLTLNLATPSETARSRSASGSPEAPCRERGAEIRPRTSSNLPQSSFGIPA